MNRKEELRLLLAAALFLAAGTISLIIWQKDDWRLIVIGASATASAFIFLAAIWHFLGFRGDQYLLPVVAIFSFTSLIFLYRLYPEYAYRQFVWLMIGMLFLFGKTRIFTHLRWLSEYKYIYGVLGGILLIIPVFLGIEQGGAKSWLDFKVFNVQPSEFVKILVVMFLASFLSENKILLTKGSNTLFGFNLPGIKEWGPLLGMWGISLIILVLQRDLGTALIYFGTFLAMIYVATARYLYVFSGLALFVTGGTVSYTLFDHVKDRFDIWLLSPNSFVELGDQEYNQAYQIIQSLFAIGSGGITGTGLGAGFPKFIPAVHTDFIFSAITEEMGLMGGLGIVLLYLFFIYRGLMIAIQAKDDFSKLLASGLTALMGLQSFIIIGGVTKLLPLTGVTLPFISYGGSSLVANFIILGMLLSISHEAQI
jgi:cell division protein FtsW (lipid II flippase)